MKMAVNDTALTASKIGVCVHCGRGKHETFVDVYGSPDGDYWMCDDCLDALIEQTMPTHTTYGYSGTGVEFSDEEVFRYNELNP